MDLRRLLVAARGGTVRPDIYPRKYMHRRGIVAEYQFVSPFARFEAAFRTVKKTYNKQQSIKMVTAMTL